MRIFSFILSLWLAVSGLAAITDRYVTDAGAGSGDGSSIANAMSFSTFTDYMVTGGSFTAAAGDRFNIIGAISSRGTTTDTWVNGGSSTSPVVVRGWTAGGTTAYAGRTNGNGWLITTNFPSITYTTGRLNVTGSFIVVESLNLLGALSGAVLTLAADSFAVAVRSENTSTAGGATAISANNLGSMAFNCDAILSGASGGSTAINVSNASATADSCRVSVTSTTAPGITCANSAVVTFNTILGNGGVGIAMTSSTGRPYIRNNTITGCSDGIDVISTVTLLQRIIGNCITDNSGYAIDGNASSVAIFSAYNRYRDNAAGSVNGATDWNSATGFGVVTTDTGGDETDYVDAGSLDFSLIRLSPATSAGLPAYSSIGALQRDQTAASGGGQKAFAY
ncbi:MAG: right-handed parallel beta-helix repeat-containing protein [Verrucomicrobia bacterium]|nr:right-handed parallel beta-helix repeat-containing protein [Verrucomicrobiota bacterium]